MPSRRILIWTNRLLWTVLVGAVLALGALVSIGRYYLPYVETQQAQLIEQLNQRSGLHIRVGNLRAYWQRLSPHLVIDDFKLYNPQQPDEVVLRIAHAEVQLGLFRSIHGGTVAISKLEGRGVELALEEAELGHWRLPGFAAAGGNLDGVAELLLAIYRAELRDSRIDLHFFGGGEAHLTGGELRLQRKGEFRRVNLALSVADQAAPLTVVIESNGDPRRTDTFNARGYAAFSGLDLTPLLPAAKAFGADLRYGRIDGVAWLDWLPGAEIELRGRVSMPQFDLAALTGRTLAPLRDVAAEFLVRDNAGRRQLWLPRLQLRWGEQPLDFSHLLVTGDPAVPHALQFEMPLLALTTLREAVQSNAALSEHARDTLAELEPTGELRNIRLLVPTAPDHADLFRLRAEVAGLTVGAWQGAPGATGVNGYIDAGLHGGVFDLDSRQLQLTFPHVYREALRFDTVRGQVGWRIEPDRVRVDSGPIHADSDAGRATAQFALDLPTDHRDPPLMTLLVGLRDSGAQYRDRFIPYTLSPHLLTWLGSAVEGGRVPAGGFIYRGSLQHDDHLGRTVQLFLDVRDGRLRYQPEWPLLEDIRAAVWVDDDHLLVQSPSARTFRRIATRDVEVELQPGTDGSWLTVKGDVTAHDDDALRLLRESPLQKKVGAVVAHWGWRGRVGARLDLGLPLSGTRPQALRVDAELQGGELLLADQSLRLTDVRGPLLYRSEGGLQSSGLSANWYGRPLVVKVGGDGADAMRVDIDGRVSLSDLRDWLQQPLFDNAAGETGFHAGLRIAGEQSELTIDSTLEGVAINLPPPYTKAAADSLPFGLRVSFMGDRKVSAELGDWADLQLQWRDTTLQNGVLRLGKTGKSTPASGRFILTGALEAANFDEWRALLTHFDEAAGKVSQESRGLAALSLQLRDLQIAEARIASLTLRHLSLSGQREAKGWSLRARAENAAGSVVLPTVAGEPWQIHLDYLHLPPPAPGSQPSNALADFDPTKAIPLDLRIDRLWLGDEEWGWLDLQSRPQADGLRIQPLSGELRGVGIGPRDGQPASLSWVRQSGIDRTHFSGHLGTGDIGQALQRFRFEKALTSKSADLDADFGWNGRPDQAKLKTIDGQAQLRFEQGRFLKASGSTAGALKVVGIFNFANFLRRLQLDFSDVFKDGVSFDSLDGSFALRQGVVATESPLVITSPSSGFRLAGNIDFNTAQTDMELVATLPVARNLPWVAALAAGLPAAAGVYVASKIFESQVDKIASVAYDIKGPWTDPKVKLKRVFDDKLPQAGGQDNPKKGRSAARSGAAEPSR
jgi:uncharacterized protein (TIGR02099 family)